MRQLLLADASQQRGQRRVDGFKADDQQFGIEIETLSGGALSDDEEARRFIAEIVRIKAALSVEATLAPIGQGKAPTGLVTT